MSKKLEFVIEDEEEEEEENTKSTIPLADGVRGTSSLIYSVNTSVPLDEKKELEFVIEDEEEEVVITNEPICNMENPIVVGVRGALLPEYMNIINKTGIDYKEYQYEGVNWCIENEKSVLVRGGIIADEMGLGKTIMMISLIMLNEKKNTLIILPSVLLEQWEKQIKKITGNEAVIYYGKNRNILTNDILKKSKIVLTTYHTLLSHRCILHQVNWSRIIIDEAHHLCNSNTKLYRKVYMLHREIMWLVTGTPIRNKIEDFYNMCYLFGLKPKYYTNIDNYEEIRNKYILRRTREEVGIILPPLIEERIMVEWESKEEYDLAMRMHSHLPNATNVGTKHRGNTHMFPLEAIMRTRQSCILPKLLGKEYQTNKPITSSKLNRLVSLITERKENGNGKIVFCHFRQEIDTIKQMLGKQGIRNVITFDGRNSTQKDLLTQKADVLILQIQSCCEGLNLQENYNEVYFISPNWNPFIEDQAIARCYRIGQTKNVYVYHFEMSSFGNTEEDHTVKQITIDNYIKVTQERKRNLSKFIIDGIPIPHEDIQTNKVKKNNKISNSNISNEETIIQ
jgi:SNF2 family DNA or RNA helicase